MIRKYVQIIFTISMLITSNFLVASDVHNLTSDDNLDSDAINILAVGITGHGKSTAINGFYNIANQTVGLNDFKYVIPGIDTKNLVIPQNITEYCHLADNERGGESAVTSQTLKWKKYCFNYRFDEESEPRKVCLIDTPGFMDSHEPAHKAIDQIISAIEKNRINAVGVVIAASNNRSIADMEGWVTTVKHLKNELLMNNFLDNMIVIGTNVDNAGEDITNNPALIRLKTVLENEDLFNSGRKGNIFSFGFFDLKKPVDYLSGASMPINRDKWNQNSSEFDRLLRYAKDLKPVNEKIYEEQRALRSDLRNDCQEMAECFSQCKYIESEIEKQQEDIDNWTNQIRSQKAGKIYVTNGRNDKLSLTQILARYFRTVKAPKTMCETILDAQEVNFDENEFEDKLNTAKQVYKDQFENNMKLIANKINKTYKNSDLLKLLKKIKMPNQKLILDRQYLANKVRYDSDKNSVEGLRHKITVNQKKIETNQIEIDKLDKKIDQLNLEMKGNNSLSVLKRKLNDARAERVKLILKYGRSTYNSPEMAKIDKITSEIEALIAETEAPYTSQITHHVSILKSEKSSNKSLVEENDRLEDRIAEINSTPEPSDHNKLSDAIRTQLHKDCEDIQRAIMDLPDLDISFKDKLFFNVEYDKDDITTKYNRMFSAKQDCVCGVSNSEHYITCSDIATNEKQKEAIKLLGTKIAIGKNSIGISKKEQSSAKSKLKACCKKLETIKGKYCKLAKSSDSNAYCDIEISRFLDENKLDEVKEEFFPHLK